MKVFGFAGWSGSGKTTLIEKLIPLFVARGLKVSLIKHAHHTFDVDQPGKDSYRHRHAGCTEVLVSSSRRWALVHELRPYSPYAECEAAGARIRFLPCDTFNFSGGEGEDASSLERLDERYVVHFKGPRKYAFALAAQAERARGEAR